MTMWFHSMTVYITQREKNEELADGLWKVKNNRGEFSGEGWGREVESKNKLKTIVNITAEIKAHTLDR